MIHKVDVSRAALAMPYLPMASASRGSPNRWRVMMAQDPALLKVTRQGDTVQVEFTTRKILDEANIAEIGERLSEIVEKEERPRLIISFSAVDHLSSAALGTLIIINNKVKQRGGQLRL